MNTVASWVGQPSDALLFEVLNSQQHNDKENDNNQNEF